MYTCICVRVHRCTHIYAVHRLALKDGIMNFVVYFILKGSTLCRTLMITK